MPLIHLEPPKIEAKILRDRSGNGDEVAIIHPETSISEFPITAEQAQTLRRKYDQSPDGSTSFEAFLARVKLGGVGTDSYLVIQWCGMWLGIETDGYTHS